MEGVRSARRADYSQSMGLTELFDLVPARGSSVTSPWPGDQDAQSSQQADETCLEAGAEKTRSGRGILPIRNSVTCRSAVAAATAAAILAGPQGRYTRPVKLLDTGSGIRIRSPDQELRSTEHGARSPVQCSVCTNYTGCVKSPSSDVPPLRDIWRSMHCP